MDKNIYHLGFILIFLFSSLPHLAFAEGSADMGATGRFLRLEASTPLSVDILDHTVEDFTWTGTGNISVLDPSGAAVPGGPFASGTTINPDQNGVYQISLGSDQTTGVDWDITVNNAVVSGGRVFSTYWDFNATNSAKSYDLFVVVPAGSSMHTSVIQMQFNGINGNRYQIGANATGLAEPFTGRSVEITGCCTFPVATTSPFRVEEYNIYITPPTQATYSRLTPSISSSGFSGGSSGCNQLVPGQSTGNFTFVSNVEGSYRVICDVNQDGIFDATDDDDTVLYGEATNGINIVTWDGLDRNSDPIASGTYSCQVSLSVGDVHIAGLDVESFYPGIRMFDVSTGGGKTGLHKFWNDTPVQAVDIIMPNGQNSLEKSPVAGLPSGGIADPISTNSNTRGWSGTGATGKGNERAIDTYTFLEASQSTSLVVIATTASIDTDGDGLTDFFEACQSNTDPTLQDTDGDLCSDPCEIFGTSPPAEAGCPFIMHPQSPGSLFSPISDPNNPNTDGGSVDDCQEAASGGDPRDNVDDPPVGAQEVTGDVDIDTDSDGLTDAEEIAKGSNPNISDVKIQGSGGFWGCKSSSSTMSWLVMLFLLVKLGLRAFLPNKGVSI